jgi:hypothetical protein
MGFSVNSSASRKKIVVTADYQLPEGEYNQEKRSGDNTQMISFSGA